MTFVYILPNFLWQQFRSNLFEEKNSLSAIGINLRVYCFKYYINILPILKVETIGDAYCVAGNLQRSISHHAQRVTWMALRMIEASTIQKTHLGEQIKVQIFIFFYVKLAKKKYCSCPE